MSDDYRKNIGEKIKKFRVAAHLSQMALAEKIGISYQQLQKYEKGINNIPLYRLKRICELLGVPLSTLVEGEATETIAEDIGQYGLSKEERALLDLFRRIENRKIRRSLFLVLKGIIEEIHNKQ